MVKKCAFNFCPNTQVKKIEGQNHVQFHSFPLNRPVTLAKWLVAMRADKDWFPSEAHRLCSQHFDTSCFKNTPGPRKLLLRDAVPTIFDFTGSFQVVNRRKMKNRRKNIKTQRIKKVKNECIDYEIKNDEDCLEEILEEVDKCNVLTEKDDVNFNILFEEEEIAKDDLAEKSDLTYELDCIDQPSDADKESDVGRSSEIEEEEEPVEEEIHLRGIASPHLHGTIKAFSAFRESTLHTHKLLRRKIKVLQMRMKRRDKRISELKNALRGYKDKVKQLKRTESLSSELEGFPSELVRHTLKNKNVKKNGVRYSGEMKEFALTLYYCSPKAYEYVRSLLHHLPNPSLIKKWISILNKPPQPHSPTPTSEIINNITEEELIIDNIHEFILIENPQ